MVVSLKGTNGCCVKKNSPKLGKKVKVKRSCVFLYALTFDRLQFWEFESLVKKCLSSVFCGNFWFVAKVAIIVHPNKLALPMDKMLYIYLQCSHFEHQNNPFQSKQSKTLSPKKLLHLLFTIERPFGTRESIRRKINHGLIMENRLSSGTRSMPQTSLSVKPVPIR